LTCRLLPPRRDRPIGGEREYDEFALPVSTDDGIGGQLPTEREPIGEAFPSLRLGHVEEGISVATRKYLQAAVRVLHDRWIGGQRAAERLELRPTARHLPYPIKRIVRPSREDLYEPCVVFDNGNVRGEQATQACPTRPAASGRGLPSMVKRAVNRLPTRTWSHSHPLVLGAAFRPWPKRTTCEEQ
jgi:hypothetical protein